MIVCIVHDLAESVVGDITPHCKVTIEEKQILEEVSLSSVEILQLFPFLHSFIHSFFLWNRMHLKKLFNNLNHLK